MGLVLQASAQQEYAVKLLIPLICMTGLVVTSVTVFAQSPSAKPAAGLWDLSITMEGAPVGGGARTAKACLGADALATAPEQTLLEAASRQSGSRPSPKCEFNGLKREGEKSSWQALCEGPMGKMQGTGSATLATETAELQQAFAVKAPIGSLSLKQTVSARRVGSC
jgi:Protein of unknown function (DUF3617)